MALIDDINALPTTVGDGNTGHLNSHQVIHAALKNHESRLTSGTAYVDGRVPPSLALRLDTTVGTRIMAGTHMIHGDTGLRNIATLMSDFTSAGFDITIRRVNNLVQLGCYVRLADKPIAVTDVLMTLPAGFRPASRMRFLGERPGIIDVINDGQVVSRSEVPEGVYLSFSAHFMTSNPWPTTLPGTPA